MYKNSVLRMASVLHEMLVEIYAAFVCADVNGYEDSTEKLVSVDVICDTRQPRTSQNNIFDIISCDSLH